MLTLFISPLRKLKGSNFFKKQWEFGNLSSGSWQPLWSWQTQKQTQRQMQIQCKYKTSFLWQGVCWENNEILAICLWGAGSLWARSSIRRWQAFTGIQQAAMINLPQVSKAATFFLHHQTFQHKHLLSWIFANKTHLRFISACTLPLVGTKTYTMMFLQPLHCDHQ